MVAQSPVTSMRIIAQWAVQTKMPVLSVDYKLAPEYPYPYAVNECFEVYKWLLLNAHQIGLCSDKIVFAGESAGATLCAALSILCLKENIPLPRCNVLIYPLLSLDISPQTHPSRYLFANDWVLPRQVRIVHKHCYIGSNDEHDPLITPGAVSDEILKGFPPCHFFVGSQDPLRDDSTDFHRRLCALRKESSLNIYPGVTHGFYALSSSIPEAAKALQRSIEVMQAAFE